MSKIEPTPISKKNLTEDVNNNMKLDQLVTKYGTNTAEMKRFLKEAGLTIKKTKRARFILVNDEVETVTENNTNNQY